MVGLKIFKESLPPLSIINVSEGTLLSVLLTICAPKKCTAKNMMNKVYFICLYLLIFNGQMEHP
jgi:hypothetical protein